MAFYFHAACAPPIHPPQRKNRAEFTLRGHSVLLSPRRQEHRIQSNSSLHTLGVRIELCRHPSPRRPILRQISSLIYPRILRRQVIMDVLNPSCARSPRWSPPVLWRRFENGLASICVLVHSCKMPKESETTGLNGG